MKKKLLGRLLGVTLSAVLAFNPSITAFAVDEPPVLMQGAEEEVSGEPMDENGTPEETNELVQNEESTPEQDDSAQTEPSQDPETKPETVPSDDMHGDGQNDEPVQDHVEETQDISEEVIVPSEELPGEEEVTEIPEGEEISVEEDLPEGEEIAAQQEESLLEEELFPDKKDLMSSEEILLGDSEPKGVYIYFMPNEPEGYEVNPFAYSSFSENGKYPDKFEAYECPGFYITGWYAESSCKTKVTPGMSLPATITGDSLNVYAKWAETAYTVNFHTNLDKDTKVTKTYKMIANGDVSLDPQAIFGDKLISDKKKESFQGWYSTGTSVLSDSSTVKDLIEACPANAAKYTVDLYADWNTDADCYVVEFDASIGDDSFDAYDFSESAFKVDTMSDLIVSEKVHKDQRIILSGNEFVRKGYTLTGWTYYNAARKKNLTLKPTDTIYNLAEATADGDNCVTLKANWKKTDTYTIKFNLAGSKYTGEGTLPSKYSYSTPYVLPTESTMKKTGYRFYGWTTGVPSYSNFRLTQIFALGKNKSIASANVIETGNVTLNAVWLPITYNGAFDLDGGEIYIDGRPFNMGGSFGFEYDRTISFKSFSYKKAGYTFKNWTYVDEKGVTRTIAPAGSFKNLRSEQGKEVILKANWTPNKYTITYNLPKGIKLSGAPKTYTADNIDSIVIPYLSTEGYSFQGWNLTMKDGSAVTCNLVPVDNNDASKGYKITPASEGGKVYGNLVLSAPIQDSLCWATNSYDLYFVEPNGSPSYYGKKLKYTESVDFTANAMSMSTDTKTVKGFALKATDKSPKFVLNKSYSMADIVKAAKPTSDHIILYAIEEVGKGFIAVSDLVSDEKQYKFINYAFNKDFKVPSPKRDGYIIKGWKTASAEDQEPIDLPWEKGKDYTIDSNFNLTIKKAGAAKFNMHALYAVMEPVPHRLVLLPNANDVVDNNGNRVAKKRIDYTSQIGGEFSIEADNTIEFPQWSRPGYNLVGFAKTAKLTAQSTLFTSENVLSELVDSKSGTISLYAIWSPYTDPIEYYGHAIIDNGISEYETKDVSDQIAKFKDAVKESVYGKTITLPSLSLPGYKFIGWELVSSNNSVTQKAVNGKIYQVVTQIKNNNVNHVKLIPHFEELTYTLSINPNGGTVNGSKKPIVLAKNVRYSEYVGNYISDSLKLERPGYILDNSLFSGKSGALAYTAKPTHQPQSAKEACQWVSYNSTNLYFLSKSVTVYVIWEKISLSTPQNGYASIANTSSTPGTNTLKICCNGLNGLSSYEVQYSTSSTFSYNCHSEESSSSRLANGLTVEVPKGKQYYVRIREYQIDSTGKSYPGAWSKTFRAVMPYEPK